MAATEAPSTPIHRRVGAAWRQIRRGASMVTVKDLFYGQGGEPLDIALADALVFVCTRGPLRMGELADLMHITPASTTRAVGCLVDKGMVERIRAEDDQRSIVVTATDAGRMRYEEINRRICCGLARILSDFSPEEQAQLADYLERFVEAVDKLAASAEIEPQTEIGIEPEAEIEIDIEPQTETEPRTS